MALGWLRWRAWAGVSGVAAAAIGVVGVVLWHFEILFFFSRGRHDTWWYRFYFV